MYQSLPAPPLSLGSAATLACIWEASAPKPGNVYRGADFANLTYIDLVTGAAAIGPVFEQIEFSGVGAAVFEGVQATHAAVATNANLGVLLLLAPLAAADRRGRLRESIGGVLKELDEADADHVYAAIRLAQPGGLGRVEKADVIADASSGLTLAAAMHLAADRDLIARQYDHGFVDVFATASRIDRGLSQGLSLADAIVLAFLEMLAERPDTLIERKCGAAAANDVSVRCRAVLESRIAGPEEYQAAVAALDFYLRSDGNRRNPGATADVIAAALFVLLRENRIHWPATFYG